jgi:hypothetical protein
MTRVVLTAAHPGSDPTNNRLKISGALSALPHAARSAAPSGAALVLVRHLFELFDALDPVVLDRVWQTTKYVISVFHSRDRTW